VTEHEELVVRIDGLYPALSPQLRRAARHLRRNLTEVALYSLRDIAARARVSPASMSRLTARLGFDTYEDLRERVRGLVMSGADRYANSARDLTAFHGSAGFARLVGAHVALLNDSVQRAFAGGEAKAIEAAAARIAKAKRIWILGLRSNYSAAFYFHYLLRTFRDDVVLLEDRMGMLIDELAGVKRGDVLLVISYEPYAADAVKAVEHAGAAGAAVIALTDGPHSPVARHAKHTLVVPTTTTSFYQSMIPTLAILEVMVSMSIAAAGAPAVERIREEFARRERFGVYWQEPR
jgi:DNA-binding MurR/RpiR family transcriptional regulator